jgi:1-acyl-sn-glycerol-3-phosphate acyltransferase
MLKIIRNLTITVILWIYYIFGFFLVYSPFYLYAFFFSERREEVISPDPSLEKRENWKDWEKRGREEAFQNLNHRLHESFFSFLRMIVPKVKWRIAEEVKGLRSSIIIANHLSFLDPILFVSLFEKQKTIVKSNYFKIPVFGWILKTSGYIPSLTESLFTEPMMKQIKYMKDFLAAGGNLFIFPEGTRSRDGRIGPLDRGAFRIAKLCNAPIAVIRIRDTHKVFPPGKFLFNTWDTNIIEVELAGTLVPSYESEAFSLSALMAEAGVLMERKEGP